jgi:dienelactone hydrolase
MPRRTRRAVITGLGAALVGLSGCQGSSSDSAATTTPEPGGGQDDDGPVTVDSSNVFLEGVSPALKDESPGLELSGIPPETAVTLETTTTGAKGKWQSSATFQVEADGFTVGSQVPTSGDWSSASGSAPIWAMKPGPDTVSSLFDPGRRYEIDVRAIVDGEAVASETLVRRRFSPAVTTWEVGASDLVGYYAHPPTNRERPGVILLHGAGGNVMRRTADMLAARGFHALALKYFGPEDPLPDTFVEVPRSYFDAAATWLREQDGVAGDDLGVYGWDAGGEGALFLAGHADWVGAVVALMPSAVATWGLEYGGPADAAKWSVDGEAVPYLSPPDGSVENAYQSALTRATPGQVETATFPIQDSSGPILLVSGELDAHWPSARLAGYAVSQLESMDEGGRVDHVTYPKVGHRIPIPYTPTFPYTTGNDVGDGATPAAVARAATDSWERTLSTFGRLG